MRTLKELLPKRHFSVPEEVDEQTVFHIAKRVLVEEYGIKGGENITPVFYSEKKLFLAPRSSLWASEILLEQVRLRERINEILGREVIREIKISRQ